MKIGLLGRKIGMTRIYDEKGNATAVTVIEAGGNTALQLKNDETDGYSAVQVGFAGQKEQRVNKPMLGIFKKAGSEPKRFVREFRLPDGTDIGPKQYPAASTVATLKETIIAQWPKGSFLTLATYLPLLSFFVRVDESDDNKDWFFATVSGCRVE
jgi:ribosomal protein L3